MGITSMFQGRPNHREALADGYVYPDSMRCVQCGICSYNCPIDLDVRRYAWLGTPINNSHCLTCGECVARCPRGVLRFERMSNITKLQLG